MFVGITHVDVVMGLSFRILTWREENSLGYGF